MNNSFAKIRFNQNGFTLVETILYMAIVATLLLAVSFLFAQVLESRTKHQSIAEVEEQGAFVMNAIIREIKNSEGVNFPTPGTSASQLSLQESAPENNPIIFDANNGSVTESVGANNSVSLLAPNVFVSRAVFTNLAASSSPANIRVELTLKYSGGNSQSQYTYEAQFEDSATIRK